MAGLAAPACGRCRAAWRLAVRGPLQPSCASGRTRRRKPIHLPQDFFQLTFQCLRFVQTITALGSNSNLNFLSLPPTFFLSTADIPRRLAPPPLTLLALLRRCPHALPAWHALLLRRLRATLPRRTKLPSGCCSTFQYFCTFNFNNSFVQFQHFDYQMLNHSFKMLNIFAEIYIK